MTVFYHASCPAPLDGAQMTLTMQAVGMVNDHMVDCFRHKQVAKLR